jgi:hypothetical protein
MESITNFFKNKWNLLIILSSIVGIVCGFFGFTQLDYSDRLYETFRMFTLNYQFDYQPDEGEQSINGFLQISRWTILCAIILFSFKFFLTILAPRFLRQIQIRFYKNHIVICGMNDLITSLMAMPEYVKKKIVVISDNGGKYSENFKRRNIKVIEGNPNDINILKLANIQNADKLYILNPEDQVNVEIAHKAFSVLEQKKGKKRKLQNPLKCFTLIKDNELKIILEESPLFNYSVKNDNEQFFFDGILCNISEMGIRFGLHKQFHYIFSKGIEKRSSILIAGLGMEAEYVICNLAHGITSELQPVQFTIIEKDAEVIRKFEQKYHFLKEFILFDFIHADIHDLENHHIKSIIKNINQYASIFVCCGNQIENIKNTWFLSNRFDEQYPPIITFCHQPENLSSVLNMKITSQNTLLEAKNIHIINTFEEVFHYTMQLDEEIEKLAKKAHEYWNKRSSHKVSYNNLSEHFKQSNRNQVLDMYYKLYLLKEIQFGNSRNLYEPVSFTEEERERLAIMEHRRWMIEKYANGWKYDVERADKYKKHDCLKPWEELSRNMKDKDFDTIDLMINTLNQTNNE